LECLTLMLEALLTFEMALPTNIHQFTGHRPNITVRRLQQHQRENSSSAEINRFIKIDTSQLTTFALGSEGSIYCFYIFVITY